MGTTAVRSRIWGSRQDSWLQAVRDTWIARVRTRCERLHEGLQVSDSR